MASSDTTMYVGYAGVVACKRGVTTRAQLQVAPRYVDSAKFIIIIVSLVHTWYVTLCTQYNVGRAAPQSFGWPREQTSYILIL
eukprot:SAG25_NODE_669_length_6038_cov_4.314531_2_plen_83_part_00